MEETLSLREARARYFESNGFGRDGGYSKRWVALELGPLRLIFPNTAGRVRAVRRHDLHHVLTGYSTTATGEAEIGAWEIAAGCGRFAAAWALDLWALAYGVAIAPGAMWRAFRRGRRSRSLYRAELDEGLLERPVAEMRRRLGIPERPPPARPSDAAAFAAWVAAAWLWAAGTLALLLAPPALAVALLL